MLVECIRMYQTNGVREGSQTQLLSLKHILEKEDENYVVGMHRRDTVRQTNVYFNRDRVTIR